VVITCTPGSVTASIGPRATSTVEVDQLPDVLPASFASLRKRSAQSGTLIRGGGVQPLWTDARSHSAFCSREIGFRLAELSDLTVDMRGESFRYPIGLDAKLGGQNRTYPGRPVQPCITVCPELLKQDC